jgi:uncharacterized protein (TIGR03000 family)
MILGATCLAALLLAGPVEAQQRRTATARPGTTKSNASRPAPGGTFAQSALGGAYVGAMGGAAITAGRRNYPFFMTDPDNDPASNGPGPVSGPPRPARIQVLLPTADAVVLFDGHRTQQQGTERVFETPPLPAGGPATYTLTASWTEKGRRVSLERRVEVRPGNEVLVNFTGPPR